MSWSRKTLFVLLGALIAGANSAALAQDIDYKQRQKDLVALASIFGDLHHLRRTCDPRNEADIWRERMKKIIELEEPQSGLREQMVGAFNKSYKNSQRRYQECNRNARNYAASRAAEGDPIVASLTAPLYAALPPVTSEDEEAPIIFRGGARD